MRIGDTAFFNLFARVANASNSDRECDDWWVGDVQWLRERHVCWGPHASFQLTVYVLRHVKGARVKWHLLVGTEVWWASERDCAFRNGRWAHIVSGQRGEILRWFAERERELG